MRHGNFSAISRDQLRDLCDTQNETPKIVSPRKNPSRNVQMSKSRFRTLSLIDAKLPAERERERERERENFVRKYFLQTKIIKNASNAKERIVSLKIVLIFK